MKTPPPGYSTISPYLVAENASELLQFIKTVFDGKERMIMPGPDGIIMHGEVAIGESVIMLADPCAEVSPKTAMLHVYVSDVDATYENALNAGAVSEREPKDQFYGDRSAGVVDPFGNTWYMATPVEEVPPEEMERRQKEFMEKEGLKSNNAS